VLGLRVSPRGSYASRLSLRQLAEGVKPRGITLWDRRRALVPLRTVLLIPLSHSAKPLLSPVDRREFSPSLSSPSGGLSAVRSPLPLTSGNT